MQIMNQVYQHIIRNHVLLDKLNSTLLAYFTPQIAHFIKKSGESDLHSDFSNKASLKLIGNHSLQSHIFKVLFQ